MNRGIYGAASGMMASQDYLDVVANNLANLNSTGFKRDGIQFSDWLERSLRADGGAGPNVGVLGAGVAAKRFYTVWTVGTLHATDNPLDVAIVNMDNNPKLFAVRMPAENGRPESIQYTRDGSFSLDTEGHLVTHEGYRVLDRDMNDIQLDTTQMPHIDDLGRITPIKDANGLRENAEVYLGVFGGKFLKSGNNFYVAQQAAPASQYRLQSRTLEGSNVNAVSSMIDMISISRNYELAEKAAYTEDEQYGKLIDSLRNT